MPFLTRRQRERIISMFGILVFMPNAPDWIAFDSFTMRFYAMQLLAAICGESTTPEQVQRHNREQDFLAEHESIRYNAVHYGNSFYYSCRSHRWRNREAIDAGKRSWWYYRHDSARHRWRIHCHLPRPSRRLVQGRTTSGLDYVHRRRHDPVAALSGAFQAQTVAFGH